MQLDDFFEERDPSALSRSTSPRLVFRDTVLTELRHGPISDDNDLETAISLSGLLRSEFEAYGTAGGERLKDNQATMATRTLRIVLLRHGYDLKLPWLNFTDFRSYWGQNGGHGSWQARRDMVAELFQGPMDFLYDLEEKAFQAILPDAVSPHRELGWPSVDTELREMKRRFVTASTPQDYRDVGNRSVAVLEALSRTVYDARKHLRDGETEPPVDKTKIRIARYVEDSLYGAENALIRGVANKVIELAHSIKHQTTPSRRDAGIVADSVILLAHILRRVDQEI